MPTTDQHVAQAELNERLSLRLQDEDPAWAVTLLFYAAVHYVEAFFYTFPTQRRLPLHYDNHMSRTPAVRARIPRVFKHYMRLLDESIDARYRCVAFTKAEVIELRDDELKPLRDYIRRRLANAASPPR